MDGTVRLDNFGGDDLVRRVGDVEVDRVGARVSLPLFREDLGVGVVVGHGRAVGVVAVEGDRIEEYSVRVGIRLGRDGG